MFREKNRLGMFITSINSCIINSNFQVVVVHQEEFDGHAELLCCVAC